MENTGKPLQRAFTLIELLIVIAVIAILASVATASMLSSRKSANETSAIAALRLIASAEENYRIRHMNTGYGTLDALGTSGYLDPSVASGRKSGYAFTHPTPPGDYEYVVIATPVNAAGDRHFYLDESGVIRAAWGKPAEATSSPVQ